MEYKTIWGRVKGNKGWTNIRTFLAEVADRKAAEWTQDSFDTEYKAFSEGFNPNN